MAVSEARVAAIREVMEADRQANIRAVKTVIQAHRQVSDELGTVIAAEVLAALDDYEGWLAGGGFERANAARRKAMH